MQIKQNIDTFAFPSVIARIALPHRRGWSPLLMVALVGGMGLAGQAQSTSRQGVTAKGGVTPRRLAQLPVQAPRPVTSEFPTVSERDALLGPDDVLEVTVLRHPELSVTEIKVPTSGRIDMPRVGSVMATGKTLDQLTREVERRLAQVLVRPSVTVSLKQGRSRQVYVLGAVKNPSVYPIKLGWRISEALAAAGDLLGRPDEATVTLARATGAAISFDVSKIIENPSGPENRRLTAGDVLTFTPIERRVTVSGDVTKPDVYPLRRAPRLLDALNAAGWLKQRSRSTKAYLLRDAQRTDLNVAAAAQATDSENNIQLKPNDVIMVEAIEPVKVSVDGFVRTPGIYSLEPGAGVVQAIAEAGGLTTTPDLVVAGIRRGPDFLPVDMIRAPTDPSADLILQTGDVVLASEPKVTRIQVTGQVQRPGALRVPNDRATLAEAISRAGGLTGTPLQTQISVMRQVNGKSVALQSDPVKLLEGRDLSQNVQLRDGDLVSVTPVRVTVAYVSGEVARPGSYDVKPGDGVAELIARAGGPTPDAALTKVNLGRGGTTNTVDVYNTFKGTVPEGAPQPGGLLQEGDFVVVPRNQNRVLVMQSVQKPGYYSIPEHEILTLSDVLSAAGGPRDRATVKEVAVLRTTPEGTTQRVIRLDRIYKGDLTQNIALQPGDIVYVPQSKVSASVLQQIGSAFGLFLGARTVGIVN